MRRACLILLFALLGCPPPSGGSGSKTGAASAPSPWGDDPQPRASGKPSWKDATGTCARAAKSYPGWFSGCTWNTGATTIAMPAVVHACGAIGPAGVASDHTHDPTEAAACRTLAAAAAKTMTGITDGMGSEGSLQFQPYVVVASKGAKAPDAITVATIRTAFGGTLRPQATIVIEPLVPQGDWWMRVTRFYEGSAAATRDKDLAVWRAMTTWFAKAKGLRGAVFVQVNDFEHAPACPVFALALTEAGSLVGIAAFVVHT